MPLEKRLSFQSHLIWFLTTENLDFAQDEVSAEDTDEATTDGGVTPQHQPKRSLARAHAPSERGRVQRGLIEAVSHPQGEFRSRSNRTHQTTCSPQKQQIQVKLDYQGGKFSNREATRKKRRKSTNNTSVIDHLHPVRSK